MLYKNNTKGDVEMATCCNDTQTFYYKEKLYSKGTVIKVSQKYTDTHLYNGMPIWKYARFERSYIKSGITYYVFDICNLDLFAEWQKYTGYFVVDITELELMIGEIVKPIEVKNITTSNREPKKDWEVEGMGVAWATYIAALAGGLIFKEFYIAWGAASYVFFKYRKEKLNK